MSEEIGSQQKRHHPLQQRASPYMERGAEPYKKIVAAFMNHQVRKIDEEHVAVGLESVDQESAVENEPPHLRRARDRLPGLIENRLENPF